MVKINYIENDFINNNNYYKTSIAPTSLKESSSVVHLVQGLGKLIVQIMTLHTIWITRVIARGWYIYFIVK